LFRSTRSELTKTDLIIFVTPHIVRKGVATQNLPKHELAAPTAAKEGMIETPVTPAPAAAVVQPAPVAAPVVAAPPAQTLVAPKSNEVSAHTATNKPESLPVQAPEPVSTAPVMEPLPVSPGVAPPSNDTLPVLH